MVFSNLGQSVKHLGRVSAHQSGTWQEGGKAKAD